MILEHLTIEKKQGVNFSQQFLREKKYFFENGEEITGSDATNHELSLIYFAKNIR
jgi:hypothetical protein